MFDDSFIASLLPDRVRLAMARLHQAEGLQGLHALGYLGAAQDEGAMLQATQAFRRELHAFSQADATAWPRLLADLPYYLPQWDAEAGLSTDETQILQRLTSLEGDLDLGEWNRVLQDDLYLRVLRHRLHALGLPMGDARGPEDVLACLHALATHLHTSDLRETARLAGDIDALALQLLAREDAHFPALIFFEQDRNVGSRDKMLLQDRGRAFCKEWESAASAAGYQRFRSEIIDRVGHKQHEDALRECLHAQLALPMQGLLRRLLELRLWLDGFLEAAPTSDWADSLLPPDSQEALSQLLAFRKSGGAEADRDLLLVHIHDGVWALNAAYLWREVCAPMEESGTTATATLHALYADDDDAEISRLGIARADAPKLRQKLEDRLTDHAHNVAQGAGRPAVRSGSTRGVLRLLQWIRTKVDGLGEALDHLFDNVRGGADGLFMTLRRAFDTLSRCLHALFHPPTIQTQTGPDVITTTFGLGFAPVTHVHRLPSIEAMQRHTEQVMHFTRQCATVMQLLGQVLAWGISMGTNPMSWVQIGTRISRMAQEMQAGNDAPKTAPNQANFTD